LTQAGATIEHFDPTLDTINVAHLLGTLPTDPFASGTITIQNSGAASTALVFHPHHGNAITLVTLDHILPTSIPHTDIVWH
jgi:hypothetical protein